MPPNNKPAKATKEEGRVREEKRGRRRSGTGTRQAGLAALALEKCAIL